MDAVVFGRLGPASGHLCDGFRVGKARSWQEWLSSPPKEDVSVEMQENDSTSEWELLLCKKKSRSYTLWINTMTYNNLFQYVYE